jgi:hypothetical protein
VWFCGSNFLDVATDEGFGPVSCGVGTCARTVASCAGGVSQSCVPGVAAVEICNGLDDDCDGSTDEGLGALSCGVGLCARSVPACAGGVAQTCVPGTATLEVCDGADNDCDGVVDDGLGSQSCGVGACARSVSSCMGGMSQTCVPGGPVAEVCDGIDNNCNGTTDEGLGSASCGVGVCARTVAKCVGGVSQTCSPGPTTAETCNGLDDDCNGVIDNGTCGPVTTCPANQTVNPNSTVTLNTNATSPAGRPFSCAWSVVNRPATSNGTFSAPTSCTSSTYFADVVGTHTLRMTVTDSLGLTSTCDVTITVNPLGDLWVELTWSHNNDMDLHLLHPLAGAATSAGSWHTAYDCDWNNRTPSWDVPGTLDDPSLDRDDIPGKGPENTRINQPSTSHPYTIGVHMFSYAASPATVTATLKIYCAGALKQQLTKAFTTNRQMWIVGTVAFPGPGGCTFTPNGGTLIVP